MGFSHKHMIFKNEEFRQVLHGHYEKVLRLREKQQKWQGAIEVRKAVLKTAMAGQTLTRRNVHDHLVVKTWMAWPPARQMSDRMIAMIKKGEKIPDPQTRIPADVKAFWAWQES